jgi:uncharacterized coiled-coil protein SlyX
MGEIQTLSKAVAADNSEIEELFERLETVGEEFERLSEEFEKRLEGL